MVAPLGVLQQVLEWLRSNALRHDEPQERLALELMRVAADQIIRGQSGHAPFAQFVANQPWSKAEAKYRLSTLILLLQNFKENRLRDYATRVAERVLDELE